MSKRLIHVLRAAEEVVADGPILDMAVAFLMLYILLPLVGLTELFVIVGIVKED